MKDGYLAHPGIAYRHNAFNPARPTLVFIHGLSGSCSAWAPYEEALESSYNVVTYDLRGHGLSKRYFSYADYAPEHFAGDLAVLLAHLRITDCTLVAHSMGATVAVSFMHYHSGIARSILFLAPNYKQHLLAGSFNKRVLKTAMAALSALPRPDTKGKRIDYRNFGYSPDLSLKRILPELRAMTLRLYLFCLKQLYAFMHDEWWTDIEIPVTILHGTHDFFVPYRFGVELAQVLPQSKLITIPNANHMLVLNNKEDILDAIESM